MIRRVLFLGLTAALMGVIALLVVQSRRREPSTPSRPVEIVRVAPSTPTRVVAPHDLEVLEPALALGPAAPRPDTGGGSEPGRPAGQDARHTVSLRNRGRLAYRDVVLEVTYLDARGKPAGVRRHRVAGPIPPGERIAVEPWVESSIAGSAVRARVRALFADLVSPGRRRQG